jgi:anti-anti-sigma factor
MAPEQTVIGERRIDSANAGQFGAGLKDKLQRLPHGDSLVVDLTGTDYLGAGGIRELVSVKSEADKHGVSFSVKAGVRTEQIIDLAGLRDHLNVNTEQ